MSAEQGNADAMHNLGTIYGKGLGVAKNQAKSVKWYRKAADMSHAKSQNHLGYLHQHGLGVSKDIKKALQWYHAAAQQHHAPAQANLACMYLRGTGVVASGFHAKELYAKAALQGNREAQAAYGTLLATGQFGLKENWELGLKYLQHAADKGHVKAKGALKAIDWTATIQYAHRVAGAVSETLNEGSGSHLYKKAVLAPAIAAPTPGPTPTNND